MVQLKDTAFIVEHFFTQRRGVRRGKLALSIYLIVEKTRRNTKLGGQRRKREYKLFRDVIRSGIPHLFREAYVFSLLFKGISLCEPMFLCAYVFGCLLGLK